MRLMLKAQAAGKTFAENAKDKHTLPLGRSCMIPPKGVHPRLRASKSLELFNMDPRLFIGAPLKHKLIGSMAFFMGRCCVTDNIL